jgi:hypothetical protein
MRIAIVCPDDFSIVQFCGALVRLLQDGGKNSVAAVCDVKTEAPDGTYTDIMASWGVRRIPVEYYRFLSVRKDVAYLANLYAILRREQFDLVVTIATKPNVYGSIAARLAGTKQIVCSVWGLGITFGDRPGLKAKVVRGVVLALYWLGFKASSKVWFTNQADYDLELRQHYDICALFCFERTTSCAEEGIRPRGRGQGRGHGRADELGQGCERVR